MPTYYGLVPDWALEWIAGLRVHPEPGEMCNRPVDSCELVLALVHNVPLVMLPARSEGFQAAGP
eukprot:12248295-Alexandrium_andersonii.AAC.1